MSSVQPMEDLFFSPGEQRVQAKIDELTNM